MQWIRVVIPLVLLSGVSTASAQWTSKSGRAAPPAPPDAIRPAVARVTRQIVVDDPPPVVEDEGPVEFEPSGMPCDSCRPPGLFSQAGGCGCLKCKLSFLSLNRCQSPCCTSPCCESGCGLLSKLNLFHGSACPKCHKPLFGCLGKIPWSSSSACGCVAAGGPPILDDEQVYVVPRGNHYREPLEVPRPAPNPAPRHEPEPVPAEPAAKSAWHFSWPTWGAPKPAKPVTPPSYDYRVR